MKTGNRTFAVTGGLFLGVLLLAGCLEDRFVWSPDGRRAAVIAIGNDDGPSQDTGGGLYFCDPDGHLSPLLVAHVYRAAWFGDSQRLALARSRVVRSSAELAAALGKPRADAIALKAEFIWQKIQAGETLKQISDEPGNAGDGDIFAEVLCLRERHDDALQKRFGKDWEDERNVPVQLHSLVLGKVDKEAITIGSTYYEDLSEIADIRPSPNGAAIAFTLDSGIFDTKLTRTFVVPTDASSPPALVAENTAEHPDWTPDGCAIVYLRASSGEPTNSVLGGLFRYPVLDAAGRITLAKNGDVLASTVFSKSDRVRCLRDGRILFVAPELHLPDAKAGGDDREQLFAFSPGPRSAVAPLIPPARLAAFSQRLDRRFEISPDEKQVLFSWDNGEICVLTLLSGEVEKIPGTLETGGHYPAPAWRGPGEFTYAGWASPATGKPASLRNTPTSLSIILRSGRDEKIFTRDWSIDAIRRFMVIGNNADPALVKTSPDPSPGAAVK